MPSIDPVTPRGNVDIENEAVTGDSAPPGSPPEQGAAPTDTDVSSESSSDTAQLESVYAFVDKHVPDSDGESPPSANGSDKSEDPSPKASPPAGPEKEHPADPEKETPGPGKDLPDEPTEDELSSMKADTQRRVRQLLDQRRELRDETQELKGKASEWDKIEGIRAQYDLKPEHVANAVHLAGLVERDPQKAHAVLGELYAAVSKQVGATLPEDLAQQVREGELTQQHAERLAKSESQRQLLERQQQRREQQDHLAEQERQSGVLVEGMQADAARWDAEQARNDPDWILKRDMVSELLHARLTQNGIPDTSEKRTAMLESAKKQVDGLAKSYGAAKPAANPPPSTVSPRDTHRPPPKDVYEAAERALEP